MSVIGNALKAAQREKQRRSGTGGAPPLIVPLRARPGSQSFSWSRALIIAVGGGVVFGATALAVNLLKDRRPPLAPQPMILGEATAPIARVDSTKSATVPVDAPRRVVSAPTSPPPPAARPSSSRAARTTTATSTASPTPAAVTPTQQGTRDSAGAGLRIAVEQPREDVSRLFAAAVAAHRSGDLTYARTAYERVLTLVPNDVDAMNNLAILLSAQREHERAERLLRRATTLAPRNAGVWNNLGTVLRERGQSADAIAAFQQALTIDPSHEATRISLAQQYVAIGALPKARELLEQIVAANPAASEAQYTLGQILEQQGDRAGAVRAYTAFVQSAPARLATHVAFVRRRIDELSGTRR